MSHSQLQALAAERLLQDLLDPLHRPRPGQDRLLALSSSEARRKKRLEVETFEGKKGESGSPLYCVCQYPQIAGAVSLASKSMFSKVYASW